ncbi:ATP-binding protein [Iodobacter fluviatilis]|uniref:ATP-binding protein n=1 Tax=Iodobacter fluviatilis TaxID=537 RepID=UPI00165D6811|nr:ATP-binding protein [Iodobacter fluviatilis]
MEIETSSAIKLFFPNPSLVLVFYEAIANAFDAGASEIGIDISIQSFSLASSLNVKIIDNGCGFSDESFERFKKLMKPRDAFHKGIGRLVFLDYFSNVHVLSQWSNKYRNFVYNKEFVGNSEIVEFESERPSKTTLNFTGFAKEKIKSYDDLLPGSLKERIIAHFLLTLKDLKDKGHNFKIRISLNVEEENLQREFISTSVEINSVDLPKMQSVEIAKNTLDAFSSIKINFYINNYYVGRNLLTAISIDGRTVPINLVLPSVIPIGCSAVFIFSSDMFFGCADSSRQKLVLPENVSESALYSLLRREIGKILVDEIPQISEFNKKAKKRFEQQFPHLLGYIDCDVVGLIDGEEALNSAQQKLFKQQKEILQCEHLSDALYEKSLDASSRTLTEYILYREKIISKLKLMTSDNSEDEIHNLIVPRRKEYHQDSILSGVYENNAWLLDDKFMTFRTILSEKRMDEIINNILLSDEVEGEAGRPDIAMIFSADPNDNGPVDVVVVEVKKITDSEKENQYAINQLIQRAVKLSKYCSNIQRIWYYAVVNVNDEFAETLQIQKWAPLYSKGKVFYQEFQAPKVGGGFVPTPIFVLSFDAIVSDAEARNHTFLEILRDAIKKNVEKTSIKESSDSFAVIINESIVEASPL